MFHKIALTILEIILLSILFSCKGRNNLNTAITEKNNKLNIRVNAHKNGKDIHYNKAFNTKGMTKSQRDSIVHYVFDSLHVGINESK